MNQFCCCLVVDGVKPLKHKGKVYGEFGLKIWLSYSAINKLKTILSKEQHIDLLFSYFTHLHLQEAIQNQGFCFLSTCWEQNDSHNKGELEDDAEYLKFYLKG